MGHVLEYAPPERFRLPFWNVVPYLLLPGFWVGSMLGSLSLIIVPVVAALTIVTAFRGRWIVAILTVALSPMTVSAGRGIIEYARGTARIQGRGLMRGPANVDPTTRLQRTTGGCVVMGDEWIWDGAHNQAVLKLVSLFGPMRGTYDGPYPDSPTAYAAVTGAKVFDLKQLPTDRIVVDGRTIALRPGLGNDLVKSFSQGPATDIADRQLLSQFGDAHAALFGGRCVILEIPQEVPHPGLHEHRVLILIDAVSGLPIAHYYDRGGRGYFARVVWR